MNNNVAYGDGFLVKVYEYYEPNANIPFLLEIINGLNMDKMRYKWVISDLDLVPIFHGDYNGVGGNEEDSLSYRFIKRMELDKVVIMDSDELFEILKDTQTIRNGVFICLENSFSVDLDDYHPKVECENTYKPYDSRAKCEIRILDGDLFYVL